MRDRDPILEEMDRRREIDRQTFFDLTGKANGGLRLDGGLPLVHLVREWRRQGQRSAA